MAITDIVPQLRTLDFASTIRFYIEKLGFELEFRHEDFYAGLRRGNHAIHVKHVDCADPSIPYVDEGGHLHLYFNDDDVAATAAKLEASGVALVQRVHETAWNTRELVIRDDQGHTLYFGQPL